MPNKHTVISNTSMISLMLSYNVSKNKMFLFTRSMFSVLTWYTVQ